MRAVSLLCVSLAFACSDQDYGVTARNQAPLAEITAPTPDAVFLLGETSVVFEGVVSDDRDLARALQADWTLDDVPVPGSDVGEDGVVTADADLSGLQRGEHIIALTVTDTDGRQTTVRVALTVVGAPGEPVVTITAPASGSEYAPGDEITFRGDATDTATAPGELVLTWWSDLDGELSGAVTAEGSSVLFWDALSEGVHTVTLQAEDEDGEIGEDSVVVVVSDVPDEPVVAEPGDLIFTEMMINPQVVQDEVGEWVELYNTSGSPIDVAGYAFRDDDNDSWTLEGPFVVPPHGYFVLCAELDPNLNGGVPCDGWFHRTPSGGGLALANNPDEVVLARPDGLVIGRIAYDDSWFTNAVAVGVDPSALGTPAQTDKELWCDQVTITPPMQEPGTPGLENDPCF